MSERQNASKYHLQPLEGHYGDESLPKVLDDFRRIYRPSIKFNVRRVHTDHRELKAVLKEAYNADNAVWLRKCTYA